MMNFYLKRKSISHSAEKVSEDYEQDPQAFDIAQEKGRSFVDVKEMEKFDFDWEIELNFINTNFQNFFFSIIFVKRND